MATNFHTPFFRVTILILLSFWSLPSFGQRAQSPDAIKKIVTRYFDEVINSKKLYRMGEFFSSDYIWHQMNGIDIRSGQDSSHISMLRWLFTAIPDAYYTIEHITAEGDMVALNTTATGTAKSEMFGLPVAQKKILFKQMFFFRLVNHKITEEWEVVDVDGMMAQLKQ